MIFFLCLYYSIVPVLSYNIFFYSSGCCDYFPLLAIGSATNFVVILIVLYVCESYLHHIIASRVPILCSFFFFNFVIALADALILTVRGILCECLYFVPLHAFSCKAFVLSFYYYSA